MNQSATLVLAEKTELQNGVYDELDGRVDPNVGNAITAMYKQKIDILPHDMTVEQLILAILNTDLDLRDIKHLPKITKGLARETQKSGAFAMFTDEEQIFFKGFGIYIDSDYFEGYFGEKNYFLVSPMLLYEAIDYVGKEFRADTVEDLMFVLVGEKVAIVVGVDYEIWGKKINV